MLPTPKKYSLVAGSAEGRTPLTAFDKALLNAGVGNLNLIRVSSILPPGTAYVERPEIPPGSLTPIAYGYTTSDVSGELISAAIAVGIGDSFGIIMEFGGKCTAREAEERVTQMVREAFEARGIPLAEVKAKSVEHRVDKVGCTFAGAALWY